MALLDDCKLIYSIDLFYRLIFPRQAAMHYAVLQLHYTRVLSPRNLGAGVHAFMLDLG